MIPALFVIPQTTYLLTHWFTSATMEYATSKLPASVRSVLVTDLSFPASDLDIDGVDLTFLKMCRSHVGNAETQAGTQYPFSTSPTTLEFDFSQPEFAQIRQSRLLNNYPDAFTDTHGLSGAPFLFKTGAAWPKATGGPHAQRFRRELRPIGGHPILSAWDAILTDTGAYLNGVGKTFTAVMALGFANVGVKTAFCPLVVTVGVEPDTIEFEVAKSVAEYVKINIINKAGFNEIEVAIWEFGKRAKHVGDARGPL